MSISPYLLNKPCKKCGLLWDREAGIGLELNWPTCPDCSHLHDDFPDLKVRTCLKCIKLYLSIRPTDRLCPPCREAKCK